MRKFMCFVFIFWMDIHLFAQIEPVQNRDGELMGLNVKTISAYYYSTIDTVGTNAKLILNKEFGPNGKINKKYVLSIWEAVSYSNSTTFKYNEKEQLIEETTIQIILNLRKRDLDYINSFGDTPLHEKIRYWYNQDGKLILKEIFTFSTNELSESTGPSQKIIYEYDSGLLRLEKSSSSNTRAFNQNFMIEYEYNDQNNLIKKSKTYGSEMDIKRITEFTYNLENRLVEEHISDTGIPRNSGQFKYEYDETGRLKNKLVFDAEENDFVVEITYEYDKNGNKISGEKEVGFTYYENGLISSELWKDEITDQIFLFISKYEFY